MCNRLCNGLGVRMCKNPCCGVLNRLCNRARNRTRKGNRVRPRLPLQQQRPIGQHQRLPTGLQHGGGGLINHQGRALEQLPGPQAVALPEGHPLPAELLTQPKACAGGGRRAIPSCSANPTQPCCPTGLRPVSGQLLTGQLLTGGGDVDQQPLHNPVLANREVAVALLMTRGKGLPQLSQHGHIGGHIGGSIRGGILGRPGHLQAPLTAGRPQLQPHPDLGGGVTQISHLLQVLHPPAHQGSAVLAQHGQRSRLQRQPWRALQQQRLLGHAEAIGGQHTRQGMEQHPR